MNSLLDLITVILRLKRQKYLLCKTLSWKDYNIYLLALDGSPSAAEELLDYAGDNCTHVNAPRGIEEWVSVAPKIIVKKYMATVPDDECFLPLALENIVGLSFVKPLGFACKWIVLGRTLNSAGKTFGRQVYQDLKSYCQNDGNHNIRVNRHPFAQFMARLWAVHRSGDSKVCWKSATFKVAGLV